MPELSAEQLQRLAEAQDRETARQHALFLKANCVNCGHLAHRHIVAGTASSGQADALCPEPDCDCLAVRLE